VRRALALILALAAAGCLQSATPPVAPPAFDPDWSLRALEHGPDHDHADRDHHRNLSTANFEILGYDPLFSPYYGGLPAGSYFCGDAKATADGRRLAIVESRSDVGFTVADVTDPRRPRWLGELVMRSTHVYDVAVAPDGQHLLAVTSTADATSAVPLLGTPSLEWVDACTGVPKPIQLGAPHDPVPRPMSLLLISLADPQNPIIIDQHPTYGYGHGVVAERLAGRDWVLVTTLGPQGPTSAFEFYEIVATPAGGRLAPLSVYKPPDGTPLGGGGHDGAIAPHPGTGALYGWLVGGPSFTIVDLTDPHHPALVGQWTDASAHRAGYSGNLHSVVPLPDLWDGRHYTIVGPEFGTAPRDHPSGIVWVLDTTDPSHPREVAAWTLPHEVEWNGTYMFSNHYYSVHDRTLFVSMYHGGIWAVDLRDAGKTDFLSLPSIGVFLPDRDPPRPPAVQQRWTPTLQEALAFSDGTLLTFDGNGGLYTFRFDATRPAPPPTPWPLGPVTSPP
jgi:hypothetical protein